MEGGEKVKATDAVILSAALQAIFGVFEQKPVRRKAALLPTCGVPLFALSSVAIGAVDSRVDFFPSRTRTSLEAR